MLRSFCLLASLFLAGASLRAATINLNFEGFADGTNLTTQYSGTGATFTNAVVLTSGISLNEFEFPPHSGVNVISDNGGPIDVAFSTPVSSVSGYLTYAQTLGISSYDASNKLISTAASSYSNNEALSGVSGSSPNEKFTLSSPSGISSLQILGNSSGGSFTLDDLNFSTIVPEIDADSGAGALAFLAGVLLIVRDRRSKAVTAKECCDRSLRA